MYIRKIKYNVYQRKKQVLQKLLVNHLIKIFRKNWEKENLHENFNVLRFNISLELKVSDLFGKYVGDKESFKELIFKPGIFI